MRSVYTHVYIHAYIRAYIRAYVHTCTHTYIIYVHWHIHVHIYTYTCIQTYIYINTHVYMFTKELFDSHTNASTTVSANKKRHLIFIYIHDIHIHFRANRASSKATKLFLRK